jgi:hypothetical protein
MTDATHVAKAGAGRQGAGLAARSVSVMTLSGPVHQDLTNDHRRHT